jgi:hypothetical protein
LEDQFVSNLVIATVTLVVLAYIVPVEGFRSPNGIIKLLKEMKEGFQGTPEDKDEEKEDYEDYKEEDKEDYEDYKEEEEYEDYDEDYEDYDEENYENYDEEDDKKEGFRNVMPHRGEHLSKKRAGNMRQALRRQNKKPLKRRHPKFIGQNTRREVAQNIARHNSNTRHNNRPQRVEAYEDVKKSKDEVPAPASKSELPMPFTLGEIPSQVKNGPHIDAGSTLIKAIQGLNPKQINAMTNDTKQLIETQKSLMGMLGTMKPMLNDGKQLMDTFQQMFGQ